MKNIHILPTDKPSNGYILGKCIKELSDVKIGQFTKTYYLMFDEEYFKPHNIYITSDEEIKEGDWIFDIVTKKNEIAKFNHNDLKRDWKKIILTTDQDLIKDGVQAVEEDFLNWFVNNPSCDEIEVKMNQGRYFDYGGNVHITNAYKIIIPKEEPKMIECYFIPSNNTSSATICGNCNKEKMLHTIGSGIKVSKSVIITNEEPEQSIKDRIMSETSEEIKQKARDYGNSLVEKQETVFENAKLILRKHILKNKEQVIKDLDEMREKSNEQETLEEAALIYALKPRCFGTRMTFIDGAKWQEQQTIEEVFEWLTTNNYLTDLKETLIENFKKR